MTNEEIRNLDDKEFFALPSDIKKQCYDCKYIKEAVSLWCINEDAKKARGTSIPGICLCPYWEKKQDKIIKKGGAINLDEPIELDGEYMYEPDNNYVMKFMVYLGLMLILCSIAFFVLSIYLGAK